MAKTGSKGRTPRRLGAILFADAVGYSRLMGTDEEATHRAITDCIRSFTEQIEHYDGQILEIRGDGMLALFDSVVNAVRYAVEIQDMINAKNKNLPEDRQIKFRIGINIGDVILQNGGVFGDSVIIASRVEELSEPGGVCISGAVYEQIKNKLEYGYEYLGPQELKNISDAVEVFRVTKESTGAAAVPSPRPISLLRRPSVVVLPFENLSGDSTEDYFSDSIAEDIATSLSKFHGLFVIAHSSAFVYKDKTVPAQRIARDLGVRYMVRGTVRRAGKRIRSTIQLVDAIEGHNLWAQQYDRQSEDIFAVQDEISELTVVAVAAQIESAERERAHRVVQPDLKAYGLVLQGHQKIFRYTKHDNRHARELYEAAIEHDPGYARAFSANSRTHLFDWQYSWSESPEESLDTALRLAKTAVTMDDSDARAHAALGSVYLYRKEHDLSMEAYERALNLNPNDTDLMSDRADALAHCGRSEDAIEILRKAIQLNPFYPDQYRWHLGGAYFNLRHYQAAIDTVLPMHDPTEGRRLLAASYAQLGRSNEARIQAEKVVEAHPNFSLDHWGKVNPDKYQEDVDHFVEGLMKAGL